MKTRSAPIAAAKHHLLTVCIGMWIGVVAAGAAERPPVAAHSKDGRIRIDNGLVSASFEPTPSGVKQRFHARNQNGDWVLLVESLHPVTPLPLGSNRLFDATASEHRHFANVAVMDAELVSHDVGEAVVRLSGRSGGVEVMQILRLRRGWQRIHTLVSANLGSEPAQLEMLLSSFTFALGRAPSFVHTPTLKFEGRWPGPEEIQVLGDRCFHSPAVILQDGPLFAALVPDLELLNALKVVSPDARRRMMIPRNAFSVPVEPKHYTMPSALDLDVRSGVSPRPVMSFGLLDYVVQHHIRYLHPHDGSMVRTLEGGKVGYGYDFLLGSAVAENTGYQMVSRHLWERFGRPTFTSTRHLAMPFADYATTIRDAVFRAVKVHPPVAGYRDDGGFLEFELDGRAVGGLRNAAPFWLDLLGNTEYWNNVRDAIGFYEWGIRLGDQILIDRSRRIIELALAAPQNEHGLFPLIYRASPKTWQRDSYDASRGGNRFITAGHDSATYNLVAMSKTCAHLLVYHRICQADPRIPDYVGKYADWLITQLDDGGCVPSYVGADMAPCETLRQSAQSATSLWFLAELYRTTADARYLEAAEKIAAYLEREVVPRQLWTDSEQYFSCGAMPLDFLGDTRQAQPARGNLSTAWAAEGFAALYRVTQDPRHLDAGERALDYLAFTQCCWDPHFIYTAYPFGGFAVDNSDTAAMLDARQCEYAALFAWYGRALGRQDLLERGVAAARSAVVLINHPRHVANGIYRHPNLYPVGLGPENIDHEGHPQSAMRTSPGWGEASGVFTGLAGALRELEGAFVDVARKLAVGVDGVDITRVEQNGNALEIDLTGRLARLAQPWETTYDILLKIAGLPAEGGLVLRVNQGEPVALPIGIACQVALRIDPEGGVMISEESKPQRITIQ